MNSKIIHSSVSNLNSRNWTIVLALPNAQNRIIARFCNRQDAEDSARFLRRSVPEAKFEVVFDAPTFETSQTLKK
jgi:hypothetical protein